MIGGRGFERVTLALLAVVTAGWLLVAALDPRRSLTDAVLALGLATVAAFMHLVVHEAAHALTARSLGIGVPIVELGEGPALLRLRVGRTRVRIAGMHSGLTHLEIHNTHRLRARLALAIAAGPVSNLAVAATAYALFWPAEGAVTSWTVRFVIVFGILAAVLNLVPRAFGSSGGGLSSDGAALLSLLHLDQPGVERLAAESRLEAAQRRHRESEPVGPAAGRAAVMSSDPAVLGMEGTRRIFTGDYDEALPLLRRAAVMPQEEGIRALTLNNLAWTLLLARPDGWLEEADEASAEAVRVAADENAVTNTRGCVLVNLGRHEEARDLLRRTDLSAAAPSDRLVVHRHLLAAEHALGDLYGARSALLALVDDGAEPGEIAAIRSLLRDEEVDRALDNLVDEDGRLQWPDTPRGSTESRHLAEMRRAITSFVEECTDDPRHGQVRRALG